MFRRQSGVVFVKPRYVILAPDYDENSGGTIALHMLCHQLNSLGESAVIWPQKWVRRKRYKSRWKRFRHALIEFFSGVDFLVNPELDTPVQRHQRLQKSDIVVYPEVIAGNPLGGKHVVRWLLHRPGFHTGIIDYGVDDLFFKYADFAEDQNVVGNAVRLFTFTIHPAYRNIGRVDRNGSCYLIRKGSVDSDSLMGNSVKIDGLSHKEIAEVFNRCKIFYSFDESTMYSCYAAICGCVSVVIPKSFDSREEWVEKNPVCALGIAYGEQDIDHANATREQVYDFLESLEQEALDSVQRFVEITQAGFGPMR